MRTPDFLIVGAAKSGTTSLSNYLAEHPAVEVVSNRLEFFGEYSNPSTGSMSLEEYLALFQGYPDDVTVGEKSVSYLYADQAPAEIDRHCPGVKIIMILRDPIERAYSDYWHRRRTGVESLSFEEALDREQDRIAAGDRFELHYATYGLYHEKVRRYLEVFGRDRVKVFLYDDLRRDPAGVCKACYSFLGVDPGFQPEDFRIHNRGGRGGRNPVVRLLFWMSRKRPMVRTVRATVPDSLRARVTGWMNRSHAKTDYPPMPGSIRSRLSRYYREDLEKLEAILEVDLSSWRAP